MSGGEIQREYTLRPTESGGLGYSNEFRQLLRRHPGIVKAAMNLAQRAEDSYDPGETQVGFYTLSWNKSLNNWETVGYEGSRFRRPGSLAVAVWGRGAIMKPDKPLTESDLGLEVTILGKATRELGDPFLSPRPSRLDISSYFRMRLGDSDFFVKKSYATTNPGFDEFNTTASLQQTLDRIQELGYVDPQLGYSDNYQSWFVSKWEDLESQGFFPFDHWKGGTPNDYGQFPEKDYHTSDETLEEHKQIRAKGERMSEEIQARAQEAGVELADMDVNLFYNPSTGRFFYLDITSKHAGKLRQEHDRDPVTGRVRFKYNL